MEREKIEVGQEYNVRLSVVELLATGVVVQMPTGLRAILPDAELGRVSELAVPEPEVEKVKKAGKND